MEETLHLRDGIGAVVEHGRGEYGIGLPKGEGIPKMLQCASTSRGDHGNAEGAADRGGEFKVEAGLVPVGVHAGEQDFSGPTLGHLLRPSDGISSGAAAAPVAEHLPAYWLRFRNALGVNGDHDALRTKVFGTFRNQIRVTECRRVDRGFVGSGTDQRMDVFWGGNAPADGEGDEEFAGQPGREFEGRAPVFLGRCDVEEHQFVGGLRVVALGEFHGVPGIPESHEARAFDNAPVLDVEAGDDAPG